MSAKTGSLRTWLVWRSCSPATNTSPGHPGRASQITGPAQAAVLIDHLRSSGRTLTYHPQHRTLRADAEDAMTVAVG